MSDAVNSAGLYTQEQLDYVNGIPVDDLKYVLLYNLRLSDNIRYDRDNFENTVNTLTNLILDMKEKYPDLIWQTMRETTDKHGELPTYLEKYKKEIRISKINDMLLLK